MVVISAPHPNLFWENVPKLSAIDRSWYEFVQCPYIPEKEIHSNGNFIKNFYSHLENNINCELLNENAKAITSQDVSDAYKYIFSREKDWIGPLNYFRNFYFYRLREDVRIECPCLIITGNEDSFHRIEDIIKSSDFCERPSIKVIERANHCPHQHSPTEFNRILVSYLIGESWISRLSFRKFLVSHLSDSNFKPFKTVFLMDLGFKLLQKLSNNELIS